MTEHNFYRRKIEGLEIVRPKNQGRCIETRALKMPNGEIITCRRRNSPEGEEYWTAEIPLELAIEIYQED